jgi:protoporphyrin/coproporphyrin ferrochelatase
MSEGVIGVLVMAYGTPGSREEVEPYYTKIRHGRPPTEEQLADLIRRYDAIGGISPLAERTAAQVAGIASALNALAPARFDVRFGSKYTSPSIEDAVASFLAEGITTIVGITLTPHSASMGSGEYLARAEAALDGKGTLLRIDQWYDTEGFAELMARRVLDAMEKLPDDQRSDALVLFTAHSLPQRILDAGDPYPDQLDDSAQRIAAAAVLSRFEVAWQSAGRTPEPWIGPDILEVVAGLPARDINAVVICPVGFVSDHLEVLYDVDIDAQQVAHDAGVALQRTASLNDDPAFMAVLARRIADVASDA